MATTPEDNQFKSHFQQYNFNLYAIELYEKWINAKKYRECTDTDQLTKILEDYCTKLIYKAQIDLIFDRKSEIDKNKAALEKIKAILPPKSLLLNPIEQAIIHPLSAFSQVDEEEHPLPALPQASRSALTKTLQSQISYVNSHRLDLVWSRNLIDTLVGLSVNRNADISAISTNIALLNGIASYGFYFVRGGMDLAKLLKHTFLTQHELLKQHDIKTADKLRLQWGLRYASIINDIILWGPVNFLTFHYLFGLGTLGYFGNLVTAALLIGDFSLNLFNLIHTQNKFKQLKKELEDKKVAKEIIEQLEAEHLKIIAHLKWYVYYSAALCLGFITLCTFMIPGPGLTTLYLPSTLLFGSFAILGLQIILNLKDMITKLQEAGDSQHLKNIAIVEGVARIFMQTLVPCSMLLGSIILPATGLPAWFVAGAALAISSLIIKVTNDLVKNYVLKEEIAKLTKDIATLNTKTDKYSQQDLEEYRDLQDQKIVDLAVNQNKTLKDMLYATSGLSGIVAIGMGMSLAATTLAPLIVLPILISLMTLAFPHFMRAEAQQPGNNLLLLTT